MGCTIIDVPVDRRGTNPIADLNLTRNYINAMKNIKPDLVLTYTIKPNTYGGIAARICGLNTIHTVTGLGSVYIREMWQRKIAITLNKFAFKKANIIFFLNEDNQNFYKDLKIINKKQNVVIVPGSGVNLSKFEYLPLKNNSQITFTFIGRILKDKGIEEYLSAAKSLTSKYNNLVFEVIGFIDEEKYNHVLKEYEDEGIIKYLGKRNDIPDLMAKSTCIVLPSYGEGRGTVLQEGAAIGRPLITTNTYGCKENVVDGQNGFLCEVANGQSLLNSMEKFINLSFAEKQLMGQKSREKAELEFDRNIVVNKYIKSIEKILKNKG
jgi:glycosyltransferase involved in cell wall biosynthesis